MFAAIEAHSAALQRAAPSPDDATRVILSRDYMALVSAALAASFPEVRRPTAGGKVVGCGCRF